MYPISFTDAIGSGRIDSFQIQTQAEERFDNRYLNNDEDIMATLKKPAANEKTAPKTVSTNKPNEKPKAEEKKESEPRGPRAVPEGHVGLDTLAEEFGTTPVAIRRKLRNSEIQRVEGQGWIFKDGSKELAAVRKLLAPAEEVKETAPAKKKAA